MAALNNAGLGKFSNGVKIIHKEILAKTKDTAIIRFGILAPEIARKAKAGQFIVVMASEEGERIPLTIACANKDKGEIAIIFQEVGMTTRLLGKMREGGSLYAMAGPLGHSTEMISYGKVVLVGGGVGIAEIYPVAKAFKEAGNDITSILGARTKALLILENELTALSDKCFVATDDGSHGQKGFTTDILKDLLEKEGSDLVYAVGPIPMMEKVASITKSFNIKTIVSLNTVMVDATGMCGCCRVTVEGHVKFACVDGPEFDGHSVAWDELTKRNKIYSAKEEHICRLKALL